MHIMTILHIALKFQVKVDCSFFQTVASENFGVSIKVNRGDLKLTDAACFADADLKNFSSKLRHSSALANGHFQSHYFLDETIRWFQLMGVRQVENIEDF